MTDERSVIQLGGDRRGYSNSWDGVEHPNTARHGKDQVREYGTIQQRPNIPFSLQDIINSTNPRS
jgi:hypothetical protein